VFFIFALMCGGVTTLCVYQAYVGYHATNAAASISRNHVVGDVAIGVFTGFVGLVLLLFFFSSLGDAIAARRSRRSESGGSPDQPVTKPLLVMGLLSALMAVVGAFASNDAFVLIFGTAAVVSLLGVVVEYVI
jgi:hypothetical protein